jgi:F0F1-type ATP synthase assembly protein I
LKAVPAPAQVDPATQARSSKILAASLVLAGVVVGIGIPVLFLEQGIEAYMTPWGFDVVWLIGLFMMVVDFVLARLFWRRASALDRIAQGLPPRP